MLIHTRNLVPAVGVFRAMYRQCTLFTDNIHKVQVCVVLQTTIMNVTYGNEIVIYEYLYNTVSVDVKQGVITI